MKNREIKFRAWNKDDQCFFTEDHVKVHLFGFLSEGEYPVMQFTGLHDKNGKEIFEGDIVNHGDNYPSEVIWDDNNHWLEGPGFATRENGNETVRYHGLPGYTSPIEVIGNIYENPELLEK